MAKVLSPLVHGDELVLAHVLRQLLRDFCQHSTCQMLRRGLCVCVCMCMEEREEGGNLETQPSPHKVKGMALNVPPPD